MKYLQDRDIEVVEEALVSAQEIVRRQTPPGYPYDASATLIRSVMGEIMANHRNRGATIRPMYRGKEL